MSSVASSSDSEATASNASPTASRQHAGNDDGSSSSSSSGSSSTTSSSSSSSAPRGRTAAVESASGSAAAVPSDSGAPLLSTAAAATTTTTTAPGPAAEDDPHGLPGDVPIHAQHGHKRSRQPPTAENPALPADFDPFANQTPHWSAYDWFKLVVMLVSGVFWLRLALFGVTIFTIAMWMLLATCGMSRARMEAAPLPRRRRRLFSWAARLCSRLVLCGGGFLCVRSRGRKAGRDEARVLVLNHVSLWDSFVLTYIECLSPVSKAENRKVFFFGRILTALQAIFISRDDSASRQQSRDAIRRRVEEPGWPRVAIFPEGTDSNGQNLLTFRSGAFAPGVAVQPVILRYPWRHFDPSFEPRASVLSLLIRSLCQFYQTVEITYLDVYHPSPEEQADPALYAENVRRVMARAMGIDHLTTKGLSDYHHFSRRAVDRRIREQRRQRASAAASSV